MIQMIRHGIQRDSGAGWNRIGLDAVPGGRATVQETAATKSWTPPKTPWGEPDLQGIWPLNHLIATPFQRPEKYGDRRFMTEEEFAAAQKGARRPQQTVRIRSDTAGRFGQRR